MQGIGARGAGDGMRDAQIVCRLALEGRHLRSQYAVTAAQHVPEGRVQFPAQRLVLTLQVYHRDHRALPMAEFAAMSEEISLAVRSARRPSSPETSGLPPSRTVLTKCAISL